jgi:predicted amidohydrolase YtcJ
MLIAQKIVGCDPLKVGQDDIKDIRVVQTIKHGKRLYHAQ